MRTANHKLFSRIALTLVLLAVAASSQACPVCFGNSDAPVVKGVEASVIFLGVLTYLLILSGGISFVLIRRRALRLQKQQADLA